MQIWEQIKNRVKSLRNKRASPLGNLSNPPQWLSDFLGGGNLSASGLRVTEDDLLKVSAVYACVNLISNTLASLPLPTYRRKQPRGKERARDHYLYDVLQYEPNPEMTSFDFRKVMQGQLELFGNAYANIVYDMAGRVKELWPIPSVYVRPRRNDSNQLLVYDISVPNGTPRTLLASEMFHLRGFGDGLFGYPPIRYAREIAALALAAEGYGAGFFGRGAVASGIVELPGKLSEQALENFKRTFQENYGGLNNQHRILFLEQGLKFHQTTIQNDNAQFLETRKYQVEEVARFFGVPPHKIGALERATFSNIEHQSIEFVQDCIRPRAVNWEQQIRRQLLSAEGKKRFYAEFVLDGLLRGDVQSRSQYYKTGRNDGWLSANDIRELENMNPIPVEEGGDAYLINGNMVPITEANQVQEGGDDSNASEPGA